MQVIQGTHTGIDTESHNAMVSDEPAVGACVSAMLAAIGQQLPWSREGVVARVTKRPTFTLLLLCLVLSCPAVCEADTDPVEDVLATRPTADAKSIEHVSGLIKTHGTHPKILELRYYRTGQLMGTSQDPAHFRSIIEEVEQLARDAGAGCELAFRCKARIGEIYFHCLKDKQAAYTEYEGLEEHSSLAGHALDTDCRRTTLYVHIAESAFALKKWQEVEKYTRLVMAYPYLGMEDRVMYQRFYDLYGRAGNLFVGAFADNPVKLRSVEIYPSHPELYRLRGRLLAREIGAEEAMRQLLSPEGVGRALERVQADISKPSGDKFNALPTQPASEAIKSQAHDGEASGTASGEDTRDAGAGPSMLTGAMLWVLIALGIVAVVGVILVVYLMKTRKSS